MRPFIHHFTRSEDGAITVDWVVITAMAMSLALAAIGSVSSGSKEISTEVSSKVAEPIKTTF